MTGSEPGNAFDLGEDVVSPYLWWRGFRRLDAVALSHAHSDHMTGLGAVIANFRPRELWIGSEPQTEEMKALLQIRQSGRTIGIISHVSELKTRIASQIVVSKGADGGSTAEVYCG
jgi:beta-lactamase superfamily II metal-dependent hydrolase